jgi:radical SAM superfamily enzyme YgiQ (UPF0313 family)
MKIVLINPRFEVSYWGLEHALPLFGKRANLPVACLPLLAALTPAEHEVTLVDENVEPIDFARLGSADIVGVTGMSVQRKRVREILAELKRRGIFAVVGGPWVSVQEDYFDGLTEVIFVGEAEETWPQFVRDWQAGRWQRRYEQTDRTDMTRVPPPRFDLLTMRHYLFGSVQFSRGCPFQCEFCDIIVTFGRRPRLKSFRQVRTELEALLCQKMEIVFIVDDNLIGNKREIKLLLADVAAWQRAQGYPLTFFTEASLDLAGDAELMQLMIDANIQCVFIGIESPNEASLRETKKFQNIRRGGTIAERIRTVQKAGMDVWCGIILGFDHDTPEIFAAQRDLIAESRILHAMIGMLTAIPKTPLYDRLLAEGRLDRDDETEFGTNVIPFGMTREELRDGYVRTMQELYEPTAYFDRLESLFLRENFQFGQSRAAYWRRHPWKRLKAQARDLARSLFLFNRLMRSVPEAHLREEYRRRLGRLLKRRREPAVLFVYLIKCAMHFHHYTMARQMITKEAPVVNSF